MDIKKITTIIEESELFSIVSSDNDKVNFISKNGRFSFWAGHLLVDPDNMTYSNCIKVFKKDRGGMYKLCRNTMPRLTKTEVKVLTEVEFELLDINKSTN